MQAKKLLLKPRLYVWSQIGYISPLPPLPPGSKLKTLATAKKKNISCSVNTESEKFEPAIIPFDVSISLRKI